MTQLFVPIVTKVDQPKVLRNCPTSGNLEQPIFSSGHKTGHPGKVANTYEGLDTKGLDGYNGHKGGWKNMRSGYDAVVAFRREKREDWDRWAPVIKAAYEEAGETPEFAGSWVLRRMNGWAPSLRSLAAHGIVKKMDTTRGGRRAYYQMADRDGVGRALMEFGVLK